MFNLHTYVQDAPDKPGVYQMLDEHGFILYIGKAKSLRNRLSSYLHPDRARIQTLVKKIVNITVTVCQSEEEALQLEHQLIQSNQPPFNILLKDHKGHPFIAITDHAQPEIKIVRHLKHPDGFAQGPYPSGLLVKEIFEVAVKSYQLRTCSDYVFKTRTRPCLQYQLQRCSAPCVLRDELALATYNEQVHHAKIFLREGLSEQIATLEKKMSAACLSEDFESAALFRDHIQKLRHVQRQPHSLSSPNSQRIDVFAYEGSGMGHHLMIGHQEIQNSQALVIKNPLQLPVEEALEPVLYQLYTDLDPQWLPNLILADIPQELSLKIHNLSLPVRSPKTDQERLWMHMAKESLTHNKISHNKKSSAEYDLAFSQIESFFLQAEWSAIECIDIAHHQGTHVVGAIARFHRDGPNRTGYRKYRLADSDQNNDTLSMEQSLHKHFKRLVADNRAPNVLLIDGGKGQLHAAYNVLQPYLESNSLDILLIAITKDRSRKNGLETYWTIDRNANIISLDLSPAPMGLLLLQEIRDEAHRIAGQFHYQQAKKSLLQHGLSAFKGISEAKKKKLLMTFGGWKGLKAAHIEQLKSIEGIGDKLAQKLSLFLREHP